MTDLKKDFFNSGSGPIRAFFNAAQVEVLRNFAAEVAGPDATLQRVTYHLLGSEDLADRQAATALLRALQSQDWASASAHNAIAGVNDLLLGIFLRLEFEGRSGADYWVAMRSPFELFDSPSLVAYGPAEAAPGAPLALLKEA